MVAAVHGRAHQVRKTGIHQHKVLAAHLFGGAHLGQQHARFGHQVAARLQLQVNRMAQVGGNLPARAIPQAEVVPGVDAWLIVSVGHRQATPGGDGLNIRARVFDQPHHRLAHLGEVGVIHARADVHVQPHQLQAVLANPGQRGWQIGVPDAVFAVFATGVGLVAVAMAETGVDAQPDRVAR